MSEKCSKNVENIPNHLQTQLWAIFGHFLPIWSLLLLGDSVQRMPITSINFQGDGYVSEEFQKPQKPQPVLVSEKVLQYTSNLHRNMPPICVAVPCWLLSLEMYGSMPPISTAVLLRKY